MADISSLRLEADQLQRTCDLDQFTFKTTEEITVEQTIIGQSRGVQAIEFGIDIAAPGFNIFALGPTGTGRATAIQRFLEKHAQQGQVPLDWVYVNNFELEHQPRAIEFPSGQGGQFCKDMESLVQRLRADVPLALEAEAFLDAVSALRQEYDEKRDSTLKGVLADAQQANFTIVRSPTGLLVAPLDENKQIIPPGEIEKMDRELYAKLEKVHEQLQERLAEALREVRELDRIQREEEQRLMREAADFIVNQHIGDMRERYADHTEVLLYLSQVHEDVLDNVDDFRVEDTEAESPILPPKRESQSPDPFRRYKVNLFIDHSKTEGAPVIVENLPSYSNLIGRIEGEVHMGALHTDFTMIKPGSLHRANGGYLVLRCDSLFQQPGAWDGLKRALETGEIRIQEANLASGLGILTPQTITPEPIPLELKVILLGSPIQYYLLYKIDEEFSELFKIKADFAASMDRTPDTEQEYASFIAARCHEYELPHFDRAAVGRMVEYGSRLAGDQDKLSTLFGHLTDLILEAAYWAKKEKQTVVLAQQVNKAIEERRHRRNLNEEQILEKIDRDMIFIDVTGEVVGQVNGLSIVGLDDYVFGQPSRITARVYISKEGFVNIEREVALSGPIHDKGVLILRGYLGGQYALNSPLALSASITFEQQYSNVEGDSASSAELYALLSALSDYPIRQSVAVTGSVNQLGRIQPVGGVTEKIEGFFEVCRKRGLTGEQGVLIPRANVCNLMLHHDVIEAVQEDKFHIYAIDTVDQGIELLTGIPAGVKGPDDTFPEGTVHCAVQDRLKKLAEGVRQMTGI